MTKPMLLADFARLPPVMRATAFDGLSALIDTVAEHAPASHRFLRYQWFAAATAAYGLRARTLIVENDGHPVIALPIAPFGPRPAKLAMVPGSYWPFRGFPAVEQTADAAFDVLVDRLGEELNGLRIGPSYDNDPATSALVAAARRRGWAVLDRFVADSYALDMVAAQAGEGGWPRASTLKKNRFHERHLAEHGDLDWRFLSGADLIAGGFDQLAAVERKSWIADRPDTDVKFAKGRHAAFWRQAAADPAIADMLCAAVLSVGGEPTAFSFDLDLGPLKYAVANSYDPGFAKHSPGKLLYYRNLVHALDHGVTTVDWGAGDTGYKSTIGAMKGPAIRDWMLLRPGLPALFGQAVKGLWRRSANSPS